ncbi:phage/plasmid replication protein [Plasticicumulans sp.]|uniref:phage/plasmid replication domain-containing protein n=1 Tax=Plasticicumulans sp. TaxID=2307179 RepID=UPI00395D74D0
MLDWLTIRVPYTALSDDVLRVVEAHGDRIMRYCPRTGALRWESAAWDTIRSDSHQVLARLGSDALHVQGSPARAVGDADAVFGPQPPQSPPEGARAMVRHVSRALGVILPQDPRLWVCSRMDCTVHLALGSLADVRVALSLLRGVEGGRYRVSQQAGDTVYWSHRSRLRAGKAYAKGPHLRWMQKQANYSGREYSASELEAADCLLRLECRLGAQYWRERAETPWCEWSASDVDAAAWAYFDRMLGDTEMAHVTDIEAAIRKVIAKNGEPITEGTARAALGTWGLISSFGWERAKTMVSKRTWYRHLGILRDAGLSDADISAGRVIELRALRLSEARRVFSWSDLRAA